MTEKKRKTFGKNTKTWRLFQAYFFLNPESYPYHLGPLAKGTAINLTQGLNCCNVQWAEGQNMPLGMLQYSAKAIRGEDDSSWMLEISTNYKQQGLASPQGRGKSSSWMDELLAAAPQDIFTPLGLGRGPTPPEARSQALAQALAQAPGGIVLEDDLDRLDPMETLLQESGYAKGEEARGVKGERQR